MPPLFGSDEIESRGLDAEEKRWLFKALRSISFFEHATIESVDSIVEQFRRRWYNKGDVIIAEGAPGIALFIIHTGSCLVYHETDGSEVARLKEKDFFGEMSLLFKEPTCASVKTLERSLIYCYLRSDFEKLLIQNAGLWEMLNGVAGDRKELNERRKKKEATDRQ